MKVEKKDLEKSQIEAVVTLTWDELKPYIAKGVESVSQNVKIEGFRPGKATYDVLKQKVGEMVILEEAARIAINKTLDDVIEKHVEKQVVGQPQVEITKLAPENDMEYKVVLAILPAVTLCDYKNCKVKAEKVEVKDEDVQKTLDYFLDMRAKEVLSDQEAKKGDKVIVDINMFLGNVPVENGQSQGTAIIIGKDFLIPGFDKELIGAKKGEEKSFDLPYPADHHQKHLAGKNVTFKIKVGDVFARELPKFDDEFVKAFGQTSAEEFKKSIKDSLEQEKKGQAEQKLEIAIVDKIIDGCKFEDIPEILIQSEAKVMMAELQENVTRQGGKFEDYLSSMGKTSDQLLLEFTPEAVKRVKSAIVIKEIANIEKVEVKDKDVEQRIEELKKQYQGYDKVLERINDPHYKEYLGSIMRNKKLVDQLKEWNTEK